MSQFKDHFSSQAAAYSHYRPDYPEALYDYLASIVPARDCAWDCATGSGQAACALARYFRRVIATDASARQVHNAVPHPGVEYRVATAEESGIDSNSVDLITVAQALHWFDTDRFFTEARRVLRPAGILAAWTYNLARIDPAIDAVVSRLYHDLVGPYWPVERRLLERGYRDIPFPFRELSPPEFDMHAYWSRDRLLGYLRTWSAVQRYREDRDVDPVALVEPEIDRAWGDMLAERKVTWPLTVRVGAVDDSVS